MIGRPSNILMARIERVGETLAIKFRVIVFDAVTSLLKRVDEKTSFLTPLH